MYDASYCRFVARLGDRIDWGLPPTVCVFNHAHRTLALPAHDEALHEMKNVKYLVGDATVHPSCGSPLSGLNHIHVDGVFPCFSVHSSSTPLCCGCCVCYSHTTATTHCRPVCNPLLHPAASTRRNPSHPMCTLICHPRYI